MPRGACTDTAVPSLGTEKRRGDLSLGGTQEQSCRRYPGRPRALPNSPMLLAELRPCAAPPPPGLSSGSWCLRGPRPPAGCKGFFLGPGWMVRGTELPVEELSLGRAVGTGATLLSGLPQAPQAQTSPFSAKAVPSLQPRAMGRGPLAAELPDLSEGRASGRPGAPSLPGHRFSAARKNPQPTRGGGGRANAGKTPSAHPVLSPALTGVPRRKPSPAPQGLEHCVAGWRGTRWVWL